MRVYGISDGRFVSGFKRVDDRAVFSADRLLPIRRRGQRRQAARS